MGGLCSNNARVELGSVGGVRERFDERVHRESPRLGAEIGQFRISRCVVERHRLRLARTRGEEHPPVAETRRAPLELSQDPAPEAEIKKRMLASASRRIVVADGSKIGQVELARVSGITEIDLLITGPSAEASELDLLRRRGLEIMMVG